MPKVRLDRRKRASLPEKEVGKRTRSHVAGHLQTLGSLTTPKTRVIRGALHWSANPCQPDRPLVRANVKSGVRPV